MSETDRELANADLDFIGQNDTATMTPEAIAEALLPDHRVPGCPGSGNYQPTKAHIRRQIVTVIERERGRS